MRELKHQITILLLVGFLCSTVMGVDSDNVGKLVSSELNHKKFNEGCKTKILLISSQPDHPYLMHMYLYECCLLAKCLRQNSGVDAVVSSGWPKDGNELAKADAIVMYSGPVADRFLHSQNAVKQLKKFADLGKGIVALHWATGVLREDNKERARLWLSLLGCIYDKNQSNVMTDYARVRKLDNNHPISRGWMDFLTFDEYYLNMKTEKGVVPLVKVEIDNGKEDIVAWYHQRPDGGRSYANTLGHYHYNFANPSFLKMYLNGILWAAKYEIPKQGVKCRVSPYDLNLLPKPKD